MKLKQNCFKTVLKQFCFSFISLCGEFSTQWRERGCVALWHYRTNKNVFSDCLNLERLLYDYSDFWDPRQIVPDARSRCIEGSVVEVGARPMHGAHRSADTLGREEFLPSSKSELDKSPQIHQHFVSQINSAFVHGGTCFQFCPRPEF